MLVKTEALVLKTLRYGETSLICRTYTRQFGIQSYIIGGVRSSKNRSRASIVQAGMQLDLVAYQKKTSTLHRVKEFRSSKLYETIPFDVLKMSLLLFITELVTRSLKEEEKNEEVFDFLISSLDTLDHLEVGMKWFAQIFMLRLSKYIGFYPDSRPHSPQDSFDLEEGKFVNSSSAVRLGVQAPESVYFSTLLDADYRDEKLNHIPQNMHKVMLNHCLTYYRLHVDSFGEMKSPVILENIFHSG